MKLFPEEQAVLDYLLTEWYEEIKAFTEEADKVFSEKGKLYDRLSPVWARIEFPGGFVQEIRKKADRVAQLLEPYRRGAPEEVKWDEILEELMDLTNFPRMFGALINMYQHRLETTDRATLKRFVTTVLSQNEPPPGTKHAIATAEQDTAFQKAWNKHVVLDQPPPVGCEE